MLANTEFFISLYGSFIHSLNNVMNLNINSWINFKAQYATNEDFNSRKKYWYKMWYKNEAHSDTETQRF